jgi:hypothetical protein
MGKVAIGSDKCELAEGGIAMTAGEACRGERTDSKGRNDAESRNGVQSRTRLFAGL